MKCDELTQVENPCGPYYDKYEVDAAINELKEEVNNLLMQNSELCQALQVMYSAEEYTKLQDENTELKEETLNLKAKNIELQSFYDLHGNVDNYIDKLKAENTELKAKVKFCSDFELAARKDIEEMRGQHQMLKQFGHYKLSPVPGKMINHEMRQYVSYNVVCMIIKHLESENAELKQKLEDVNELIKTARQMLEDEKATHYAKSVDAGMENRKLKRALYIARAKRALEKIAWFKLWNASISTMNPEDGARQEYDKWKKSLGKFLKKAEEYK